MRTDKDVKQQEGISFLLIDMETPGITVRPIVLLDGGAEVNEVFFDNVKVPAENLVGEENKGWTYAKYLLTHERTNIAGVGFSQAGLSAVKRIAKSEMAGGRPLIENPHFAARVAQAEIDLMAMATTNLRIISKAAAGQAPGVESSMLKVKGTIIRQEINDLARRAAGVFATPFPIRTRPVRWPRSISTTVSCRSLAAPTKSSGRSSPRQRWEVQNEFRPNRRTPDAARQPAPFPAR